MKKKNTDPSTIEIPGAESEIPKQEAFYMLPARFGAIPLDEAPLGYEVEIRRQETKVTRFEHAYPRIFLPFQEVQRVEFGHGKDFPPTELFPTGANRLFFGDNLHIMRQLPSKSIDLIYIDPPFFSGRNYNVIFGDKNEVRSFSDIWEGGMPGYLIWLNARLYEMKRLLKDTGSIYIHLDWHASHYVKVEMDKIFGIDNFINEIAWCYSGGGRGRSTFARKHDILLLYAKTPNYFFDVERVRTPHSSNSGWANVGGEVKGGKRYDALPEGKIPEDWWQIPQVNHTSREYVGYPTQKPAELMQRFIEASCPEDGTVADFFCGGGSLLLAAAGLRVTRKSRFLKDKDGGLAEKTTFDYVYSGKPRRWIGCDQSRIAVAITSDRIAGVIERQLGTLFAVPDITVDHWGIYESPRLEKLAVPEFHRFVVEAFGGRPESVHKHIHGLRQGVPLYVGDPSRKAKIDKEDVKRFAQAIFEDKRTEFGVMLGWNFAPDARKSVEILAARENKRIDFVRLTLVRLEDKQFREHVTNKHRDYEELLSFVQPPEVRVDI